MDLGRGRQRGASERWMGIVGGRETEIDTQRERQKDRETARQRNENRAARENEMGEAGIRRQV